MRSTKFLLKEPEWAKPANRLPVGFKGTVILVPRPRSFWSAPRIATSGHVQHQKSAIHGLPVTLRMLRVKSDKSDWFWSQSIVFTNPFRTGMSLNPARGRDSWCGPKGARPLETGMRDSQLVHMRIRHHFVANLHITETTHTVFNRI